jgi:rubredoxin
MTKETEALKLALEALENAIAVRHGKDGTKFVNPLEPNAIAAIKEALAQPAQEPVAFYRCKSCGYAYEQAPPTSCDCMDDGGFDRVEYFTTPPKREWVGLTDEEREGIAKDYSLIGYKSPFKEIEAKLKEKNT